MTGKFEIVIDRTTKAEILRGIDEKKFILIIAIRKKA